MTECEDNLGHDRIEHNVHNVAGDGTVGMWAAAVVSSSTTLLAYVWYRLEQ